MPDNACTFPRRVLTRHICPVSVTLLWDPHCSLPVHTMCTPSLRLLWPADRPVPLPPAADSTALSLCGAPHQPAGSGGHCTGAGGLGSQVRLPCSGEPGLLCPTFMVSATGLSSPLHPGCCQRLHALAAPIPAGFSHTSACQVCCVCDAIPCFIQPLPVLPLLCTVAATRVIWRVSFSHLRRYRCRAACASCLHVKRSHLDEHNWFLVPSSSLHSLSVSIK